MRVDLTIRCDRDHSSLRSRFVSFRQPEMKLRHQFVAVLLLLALLGAPAAALSRCWMGAGNGADNGAHSCCGNAIRTSEISVLDTQRDSSCCRISSGSREPASPLLVPTNREDISLVTFHVVAITLPALSAHVRPTESAPPPQIAPSQSTLCTFLI